jgi:hypothetical protein
MSKEKHVPCPKCHGNGYVGDGGYIIDCSYCDSQGEVPKQSVNNINRRKRMKIEKNIPIPLYSYKSKNVTVIMTMEIGDSIAFPDHSKALSFYSSLRRYLGAHALVKGKATLRHLTDGTYRVWLEALSPAERLERHTSFT